MCKKLTAQLYKRFWLERVVPQDFKYASIIHLYKRKGNRSDDRDDRRLFRGCNQRFSILGVVQVKSFKKIKLVFVRV